MPRYRLGKRSRIGWSVLLVLTAGCNHAQVRLDANERADLARRAMDLLQRAAQSENPEVCSNAIEALMRVAPREGRVYARAALDSESPLIRFAGCTALGELRDAASMDRIRPLLNDANAQVRLSAAFAAVRCGDQNQGGILVSALGDSPDEGLRSNAAFLIGRLEEPRALKRLRWAADQRGQTNRVLLHIYSAMARLGDERALDELIGYVQGDASSRLIALQELTEIGAERARDALRYRLSDTREHIQTRLLAARALGRIGDDSGYELALNATAHREKNKVETGRVRALAAHALGEIGERRALSALRDLAESQDNPGIQIAACYAILKILTEPQGP